MTAGDRGFKQSQIPLMNLIFY